MVLFTIICSTGAAILAQYCNKKLVDSELVEKILMRLFLGCFLLSWTGALIFGSFGFNFYIALLGFINFGAVWSFTRGIKIGLAQTILLLPATTVVAVVFSAIFLGEWRFFDPRLGSGFLFLIGSLGIFVATLFFATNPRHELVIRRQWVILVMIYILITGLVNFLIKYFAVQNVSTVNFLVSWYSGIFLSSLLLYLLKGGRPLKIVFDNFFLYFCFIIATFGAMVAYFVSLVMAPAAFVFPIHSFLFVLGTVLVALFIFHEGRGFGWKEKIGLVLGLISGCLLLIGS